MNLLPCDILVAGGGVAGLPAAVTAARMGKRVLLLEKGTALGGSGILALHRFLCGLYRNSPDLPAETLNSGIVREIVAGLSARSSSSRPALIGRVWTFPFEPVHFREVYAGLASQEPNLTVSFSSEATAMHCEGNRITSLSVQTPDGPRRVTPQAVVDATGSGALIRLSGAPFRIAAESERQLGGITVHLDGITGDRALLAVKIAWQFARLPLSETECLPRFAGFSPGWSEHDGLCKFSVPASLTHLEDAVLNQLTERLHALLKLHLPEFAQSRIVQCSPLMEREGVRLDGEWELDEASVIQARKFLDAVVRNAWPVEFWDPSDALPHYAYPSDGDYFEIPRRCLRSRTLVNLFATGRCIAASSRALASTRVMGTCISLGEAAGALAASL